LNSACSRCFSTRLPYGGGGEIHPFTFGKNQANGKQSKVSCQNSESIQISLGEGFGRGQLTTWEEAGPMTRGNPLETGALSTGSGDGAPGTRPSWTTQNNAWNGGCSAHNRFELPRPAGPGAFIGWKALLHLSASGKQSRWKALLQPPAQ